jgi:hypothetical protein
VLEVVLGLSQEELSNGLLSSLFKLSEKLLPSYDHILSMVFAAKLRTISPSALIKPHSSTTSPTSVIPSNLNMNGNVIRARTGYGKSESV